VDALRDLPAPAGLDTNVGGQSALLTDLVESIKDRGPLMIGFVALAMFVVLFLVFGSVTLPLKAMVMNTLSLTASYGAMVWIFQDGRFEGLLSYESLGSVDATNPILMFAIVFGLSMDYEVLLLSRIREEYQRTGDNALAVARGLEKTGRLITSAALLLVVVIGAFATSSIPFMKQIGVGMALAIAVDATIVRALLVPSLMRMMGRWNWWSPGPLARVWERIGLGDLEGHARELPAGSPGGGAGGA
jgi:RND superfamily putative drug exporter